MPVSIEFVDDGLGFVMTCEGIVTGEELIGAISYRFSAEERTKKLLFGLSDYTGLIESRIEPDHVRRIAQIDKGASFLNPNILMALSAPKDIIFGLCRMFQTYAEPTGWDIHVCRDRATAEVWIQKQLETIYGKAFELSFKADDDSVLRWPPTTEDS